MKGVLRQLLPRQVKSRLILRGPLRGRRLVTSWHDYPAALLGRTERELLSWLKDSIVPGQTWIDVGAHYGYTALAMSEFVQAAGRVFAFEPYLPTAGALARSMSANGLTNVTVLPFALGGGRDLTVSRSSVDRGMATWSHVPRESALEQLVVVSFDSVWPRIGAGRRVDGVKIDVQGMELEVLRGMQDTLRQDRPMLAVEFHAGADRFAIADLLKVCGYETRGSDLEGGGAFVTDFEDNRSYGFNPKPA